MADQDNPDPDPYDLYDIDVDFLSLHSGPQQPTDSSLGYLNTNNPPDILNLNGGLDENVYRLEAITPAQTSRHRSGSDSSGSHTPTEKASPLGSPNQKYEELAPSSVNYGHRRNDRRFPRDAYDDNLYEGRLQTFEGWQHPTLAKEVLAEAGFCYTGESGRVRCCKCRRVLKNWKPNDDPRSEHRRHFHFDCF